MSLQQLIRTPCTIHRSSEGTERDENGDRVFPENDVESRCWLEQAKGFRDEGDGQVSESRWNLYLLPDAEIDEGDSVTVDGLRYEVFSTPWPARNPRTQRLSHIEVVLVRTAGPGDGVGS